MQPLALIHMWYDPEHFHRKCSYLHRLCSHIHRNVYSFIECVLIRSLAILSNWISLMTLWEHILWMNKQILRHAAIGTSDVSFIRDMPQHTCIEYAHTCTECVFILIECVLTFIQCVLSRSSLLCGDYAAIDTSDAGGMNLMDLSTPPPPPTLPSPYMPHAYLQI